MTTKAILLDQLNKLPDDQAIASLVWVDKDSGRIMSVTPNVTIADAARLATFAANGPGQTWQVSTTMTPPVAPTPAPATTPTPAKSGKGVLAAIGHFFGGK